MTITYPSRIAVQSTQTTSAFQQLESSLSHHLAIICANPSRVAPNNLIQRMLDQSSFNNLVSFARTVPVLLNPTRLYPPERISAAWTEQHASATETLTKALKVASLVEQRRNQLVHSSWVTDSDINAETGNVYRVKMRNRNGSVEIVYEEITASAIFRDIRRCREAEDGIHQSLSKFAELSRALIAFEG